MRSHSRVTVLALLAASPSLASIAWTQADSSVHLKPEVAAPAATTAPDTAAHKHGMFGKLKSLSKNKTVQSIAKTAVCSAVPGGSMLVSAVDAHKSGESASQALKGAAGGVGSPGCMPGIPGMPGGKGMGAMGAMGAMGRMSPGIGSKGAGGALAAAAAVQTGAALQTAVMNGAIARASSGGASGAGGAPNAANTQAMMSQMQTSAAATGDVSTEAAGKQLQLSGAPADEIRKGKLVIKHIDWMRGSAGVSASSMSGFVDLLHSVGDAVKVTGARYRVDIYMDKQYSDADIAALAPQRVGMMLSLLQERVQLPDATISGNIKKDKEQRVEIVRIK